VTALVVVLLTALPMAACGYAGWRLGGRRLAASMGGFALASSVGVAGMHFGWTWPFGLLTPAVATLLTAVAALWLLARWTPDGVTPRERSLGAALGAVSGILLAGTLWIAAALGEGVATAPQQATEVPAAHGWTHALVRTANRGFVRHLPVLGPLGDEVEATVAILNAPLEARRELAEGRQWQRLTELPSYHTLTNDEEVQRDLESVRDGSVLALYRLQRNPHVVAFMREPEVRALLPGLRPTVLARELQTLHEATTMNGPRSLARPMK